MSVCNENENEEGRDVSEKPSSLTVAIVIALVLFCVLAIYHEIRLDRLEAAVTALEAR